MTQEEFMARSMQKLEDLSAWRIIDWAGNDVFQGASFRTADEAEEFLDDFLGDDELDENRGEYQIVKADKD